MNRNQRDSNRATAEKLRAQVSKQVCPECGEITAYGHYAPGSLLMPGFWTCDKFYGEDGRRIDG